MSYGKVREALDEGVNPTMICQTCPWDRFCVHPPALTRQEVEEMMDRALMEDEQTRMEREGTDNPYVAPLRTMIAAVTIKGEDTKGEMCPVFSMRLQTSGGKKIAESLREQMQAWDDGTV